MGIQVNRSTGVLVIENKVENARWGIAGINNIADLSLQCNTVENCHRGFFISGTCNINGSPTGTLDIVGDFTANVASGNRWVGCTRDIHNNSSIMLNWWYFAAPSYIPTTFLGLVSPMNFITTTQPSCFPAPARLVDPNLAFEESEEIKIYPNPASNIVNISLQTEDATLLVYDLTGRLVLEQNLVVGNNIVDINSLNAGIYQSKIITSNTIIGTGKIVISR